MREISIYGTYIGNAIGFCHYTKHPGALNQAIKGIAIARGFVAPSGKNLVCIPAFVDISIDGEERTAIKLIVEAL